MPTAPLPRPQEPADSGTTLLIFFTLTLLIGMVPILLVGVFATWVSLAIAMVSVLALAGCVIAVLARYLGE